MSNEPQASTTSVPQGSDFSIVRILLTVAVIAVVGGGAFFANEYLAGQPDRLYPVHGMAYLDGEPMPDGVVMSLHTDGGLAAIAPINSDGTFELKTNGEPGAVAGVHKLRVAWTDGNFPPFSYIPEHYTSADKTPFSVDVDSSTGDAPLKLELTGKREPPARPAGGEAGGGGGSRYPSPPESGDGDAAASDSDADSENDAEAPADDAPRDPAPDATADDESATESDA